MEHHMSFIVLDLRDGLRPRKTTRKEMLTNMTLVADCTFHAFLMVVYPQAHIHVPPHKMDLKGKRKTLQNTNAQARILPDRLRDKELVHKW